MAVKEPLTFKFQFPLGSDDDRVGQVFTSAEIEENSTDFSMSNLSPVKVFLLGHGYVTALLHLHLTRHMSLIHVDEFPRRILAYLIALV